MIYSIRLLLGLLSIGSSRWTAVADGVLPVMTYVSAHNGSSDVFHLVSFLERFESPRKAVRVRRLRHFCD